MKITPVKGTNDYLPSETELRDFMKDIILRSYQSYGFRRIYTPAIEDIENLDKSDGGENLNLIFKILKRGKKLEKSLNDKEYNDLADIGLRYDLTLPLSRYFANNRARIMMPMKCIQIDKVYRAERPQKGRLREFVQCDIDIIGSTSVNSEIELIDATANTLLALGINDFIIKINDRRILKSFLLNNGFDEHELDAVSIIFDKVGKLGLDELRKEFDDANISKEKTDLLIDLIKKEELSIDDMDQYCTDKDLVENIKRIINTVNIISENNYKIKFDISLVRGQGYYTGTVFEIESESFRGSIAGGGRYDNLIGKFIKEDIPAVGFSIGFERIYAILLEKNYQIKNKKRAIAILYDPMDLVAAHTLAKQYRQDYDIALYELPKKTGKFLDKLEEQGYYGFCILGKSEDIKKFEEKC